MRSVLRILERESTLRRLFFDCFLVLDRFHDRVDSLEFLHQWRASFGIGFSIWNPDVARFAKVSAKSSTGCMRVPHGGEFSYTIGVYRPRLRKAVYALAERDEGAQDRTELRCPGFRQENTNRH